jgi:hypothetical protein
LSPKVFTLADGATITVNAELGNVARLLLTGSGHTIAYPTNLEDGQALSFDIQQPAVGGPCTVVWAAGYDFGTDGAPTLSAGANDVDTVGFRQHNGISALICQGWKLGN